MPLPHTLWRISNQYLEMDINIIICYKKQTKTKKENICRA